ncbi:MAG: hypothetical protein ACLR0U_31165 [Enterocloster clostridioformis]
MEHALPFHEYTVSFLVYAVWDPCPDVQSHNQ